ncbi:hypothetical protein [uncultured Friedmanniella sp.]|uniref:hypothetical protein n=1 Tax=uncultured Friedmanniella sp. TaxID=335381 RepID=UPI0035CA16F7
MRDEEYPAEQIGEYGVGGQPAVAARMTPHLRLTVAGIVVGALAVVAAAAGVATFPRFTTAATGVVWTALALVCAFVMTGICVVQLLAWRQAMAWWRGQHGVPSATLGRLSWWLHVGSYAVAVVALYAGISGSASAGWSAIAASALTVSLLLVLLAQVLGAVQYVRPDGPPGTVPTHVRRMLARERARQAAAAAIVERDGPGPR